MTHFPSRRLEQAEHDGSTTLFLSSTDIGAGPREDLHGALPSAMTHFFTLLNGLLESHTVHFDLLKNTLASCHLLVLAAVSTVRMALSNMASRSNFGVTRSNACLKSSDATKSFLHSLCWCVQLHHDSKDFRCNLPTSYPNTQSSDPSCGCCTYSRIVTEEKTSTHSTTWPMISVGTCRAFDQQVCGAFCIWIRTAWREWSGWYCRKRRQPYFDVHHLYAEPPLVGTKP